MSAKIKLSVTILFVTFSTWFYFAPYLAASGMKSAAEAKDTAKLSSYINFPALKESLKENFHSKLSSPGAKEKYGNRLDALADKLAAAVINPMIDALVTPESLAMVIKGHKPEPAKAGAQPKPMESAVNTSMAYESFDRFVITIKKTGTTDQPLGLVFNREGVFSWKLSSLRLPI